MSDARGNLPERVKGARRPFQKEEEEEHEAISLRKIQYAAPPH
jgi:hypothetical protein